MKFVIFVDVKLKFIIFEGKRPLVEIDQWPEQTYQNWIFIKLTHLEELQGLQDSLLWSYLHVTVTVTDSLFSSIHFVVVEATTGIKK